MPDDQQEAKPDACPNCGAEVASAISYGIGARGEGQELPQAQEQATQCPTCGTHLRRAVGDRWSIDITR